MLTVAVVAIIHRICSVAALLCRNQQLLLIPAPLGLCLPLWLWQQWGPGWPHLVYFIILVVSV